VVKLIGIISEPHPAGKHLLRHCPLHQPTASILFTVKPVRDTPDAAQKGRLHANLQLQSTAAGSRHNTLLSTMSSLFILNYVVFTFHEGYILIIIITLDYSSGNTLSWQPLCS
jgi:hypothetical protein